jgi:hypothetical protein
MVITYQTFIFFKSIDSEMSPVTIRDCQLSSIRILVWPGLYKEFLVCMLVIFANF